MKKTFLLFFSVWLSVKMVGQAPGQMNYQGVARSALGLALPNQNIKLRVTIHDGSANGTVLYKETRLIKTNHLGLFSMAIGSPGATDVTGNLLTINWSIGGAKFLQVEMDPNGGNNLMDMGSSQLLSVPYALSAGAAIPSGAAGGMLTGLYPNPSIANGVITSTHLANNAVTSVKLADGVITTDKIADGSVTLAKLAVGAGLPPIGNAGGDLGGTYPNPIVAANAITAAKIADGAILTSKLANDAVTTAKLSNDAVTNAKLADNAVSSSKIVDGAVGNSKIANNAVNTSKIADGSITTIKIVDGSVINVKLADNAVTTSKVADGSITAAKLASGISLPVSGTASGDLTGTYPGPTVAANAINSAKLADNAVTGTKIADGAVGSAKITDGAVATTKLADGSVTTVKVADGAIATAKIADASVTNAKLVNGSVGTTKIADDAVTTIKIADGSITSAKLAAGLTIPPGGAASGDLTGIYPSPTVAANAINSAKLADNAVTGTKIADGAVGSAKLADGAVGTTKVADGAVTTIKLADGSVSTVKVADGAIATAKIADGSITSAKLAAGLTIPPGGAASGDLTGTYPSPTVAANAINSAKLADNAVTGTKIADGAVGSAKLADGAVGTTKVADGAVTTIKLADGSVSTAKVADGAIATAKIADGSITSAKLAAGLTIPPGGAASGDLTGTYPSPTVAANAINSAKLADNAVTGTKIADGAVGSAKIADGAVGTTKVADGAVTTIKLADGSISTAKVADGAIATAKIADASVTNIKLADDAVTTAKVADGSITSAKLAAGLTIPPGGAASGDLTGTYPSPTVAANAINSAKLVDNAVTGTKLADGAVGSAKIADGAVGTTKVADGAVTTIKLADGSVSTAKVADGAIATAKIADGSITSAKLAAGLTIPPGGAASGDLTGTYPSPTVAANAITSTKIADDAVTSGKILDAAITTAKLADASVTDAKLGANAVTTAKILDANITTAKIADEAITAAKLAPGLSLPPSGSATGDLDGNFPAPTVAKLKGVALSATAPASGEVLTFDGTSWAPAPAPGLVLPYVKTVNQATQALFITNEGDGNPIEGANNSQADNTAGVVGTILHDNAGLNAAGIKGVNNATTSGNGWGVLGIHNGLGTGIRGYSKYGYGIEAFSDENYGLYAKSGISTAGFFEVSDENAYTDAVSIVHQGHGIGLTAVTMYSHAVYAVSFEPTTAVIVGKSEGGAEGLQGITGSNSNAAISGINDGSYAAIKAYNNSVGGTGLLTQANAAPGMPAVAMVAELVGAGAEGNIAEFKVNDTRVARISADGTGYFANGAQTGGADVAELFDVEGARASYEAGDVLVISESSDRKVAKSTQPYSTLVAGVYATKPGLMLTEKDALKSHLDQMVPMGVIGVIPTKVCLEGGAIKRGDLLVTSSTPGVAMKADPEKVRVGQVLGKALQDYNANGVGKINVLVSVK